MAAAAAAAGVRTYEGLRAAPHSQERVLHRASSARTAPTPAAPFQVVAQRKALKKTKVILLEKVPYVGDKGDIVSVKDGFFRNFLFPRSMASPATQTIFRQIQRKEEADVAAKQKVKNEALSMATALKVIGKFIIKKKAGQDKTIFGSVTSQDVVDVIKLQTGQDIDKKDVIMPEIRGTGNYKVEVRLHPEVVAPVEVTVVGTK
eukprot:jgi/Chlat1/4878/Chrsp31S04895